jgi:hypothetical protein
LVRNGFFDSKPRRVKLASNPKDVPLITGGRLRKNLAGENFSGAFAAHDIVACMLLNPAQGNFTFL